MDYWREVSAVIMAYVIMGGISLFATLLIGLGYYAYTHIRFGRRAA